MNAQPSPRCKTCTTYRMAALLTPRPGRGAISRVALEPIGAASGIGSIARGVPPPVAFAVVPRLFLTQKPARELLEERHDPVSPVPGSAVPLARRVARERPGFHRRAGSVPR